MFIDAKKYILHWSDFWSANHKIQVICERYARMIELRGMQESKGYPLYRHASSCMHLCKLMNRFHHWWLLVGSLKDAMQIGDSQPVYAFRGSFPFSAYVEVLSSGLFNSVANRSAADLEDPFEWQKFVKSIIHLLSFAFFFRKSVQISLEIIFLFRLLIWVAVSNCRMGLFSKGERPDE